MAKKQANKGLIAQAEQRLKEIDEEINKNYETARELNTSAQAIRVEHEGNIKQLVEADELENLAKLHIAHAQKLSSEDKYIAVRSKDELLEKFKSVEANLVHFSNRKSHFEEEKGLLSKQYAKKLEELDKEIEIAEWDLEQTNIELKKYVGDQ